MASFLQRLQERLNEVPPERPPIIPKPYRMTFFVGLSVIALVVLALVVWLVVIPGIAADQAANGNSPAVSAPKK